MDKVVKKGPSPEPPSKPDNTSNKTPFNFFESCTTPVQPEWGVKITRFRFSKRRPKSKAK